MAEHLEYDLAEMKAEELVVLSVKQSVDMLVVQMFVSIVGMLVVS
jgi:hypothetical protein